MQLTQKTPSGYVIPETVPHVACIIVIDELPPESPVGAAVLRKALRDFTRILAAQTLAMDCIELAFVEAVSGGLVLHRFAGPRALRLSPPKEGGVRSFESAANLAGELLAERVDSWNEAFYAVRKPCIVFLTPRAELEAPLFEAAIEPQPDVLAIDVETAVITRWAGESWRFEHQGQNAAGALQWLSYQLQDRCSIYGTNDNRQPDGEYR